MEYETIQQTNKPDVFLLGNIKIVVFENKTPDGNVYLNHKIEKIYKKDDEWNTTDSFDKNDLPKLYFALGQYISSGFKKLK